MTFLTTPVVKISRMRKQWIPGPLPSRVGPGDEASSRPFYKYLQPRPSFSSHPSSHKPQPKQAVRGCFKKSFLHFLISYFPFLVSSFLVLVLSSLASRSHALSIPAAWCIAYKPLVLRCRNFCIANQIAGF